LVIVKRFPDDFQHCVRIGKNVVIPKPKYAIAFGSEPSVTKDIVVFMLAFVVLAAIKLDEHFFLKTGEVNDVISDRDLTTKLMASELPLLDLRPQPHFGVGHRRA
jgi:hypothetical protein